LEALVRKFNVGLTVSVFLLACGVRTPMDDPSGDEGLTGTGGDSWSIGGIGSGGVVFVGTGGVVSTGGVLGTGGTGGVAPTGGRIGTGGTVVAGTGGTSGRGGTRGFGGSSGQGGQTPISTGGRTGRGGSGPVSTGGIGGGGVAGSSGNTVTFVNGRAQGPMTGWGWIALGALDTVSTPTCADGSPVTSGTECSSYAWPTSAGLCMSGAVPAVVGSDYADNWGILMSAGVSDPQGGPLGRSFQSILFNVSGRPQSDLRGAVHRKGDPQDVNYCAAIVSGGAVMFTAFNTVCWGGGSGTPLTLADVPNLDWIGLQVVSGPSAINVSNLCLTSLVFK
jgi:hypothetical protein